MKKSNKLFQSGQVLLLLILIVSVVVTIAFTASYQSRISTQEGELKEESTKVLAAAEAGVETGLTINELSTTQTFRDAGLTNLPGIDLDRSQIIISTNTTEEFVSPQVKASEQYTFYLAPYDLDSFGTPVYADDLSIYYGSNGVDNTECDKLALEITFLSETAVLQRYKADVVNFLAGLSDTDVSKGQPLGTPEIINETNFYCEADLGTFPAGQLAIVRILANPANPSEGTRLGFVGDSVLPPQGKWVRSETWSNAGIQKIVQVFQSNPQIPANFFVTSF